MNKYPDADLLAQMKPLLDDIHDGRCVAFVGAGFSAAAGYPQWKDLLAHMVKHNLQQHEHATTLHMLLYSQASVPYRELEMAAQLIFDALGESSFRKALHDAFSSARGNGRLHDRMALRLKHLHGIPFRAIVTTNFDPLVCGEPPSPSAYWKLLRSGKSSPWREAVARAALEMDGEIDCSPEWSRDTTVVQLHGNLQNDTDASLVFTRSQYRQRLYSNPAYLTALRSMLATSTVLFLGYSHTDAYLNEIRSELVEAFSENGNTGDPLAWAVLSDVSDIAQAYYRKHEGLGVISYSTAGSGAHAGFDNILQSLYDYSNPVARLGRSMRNRQILWFDPAPDNNAIGRKILHAASREAHGGNGSGHTGLTEVKTLDEAESHLGSENPFDLVITHWGHGQGDGGRANGELLLRKISQWRASGRDIPPVIVFASGKNAVANRNRALGLGAVGYTSEWTELMEFMERLTGTT